MTKIDLAYHLNIAGATLSLLLAACIFSGCESCKSPAPPAPSASVSTEPSATPAPSVSASASSSAIPEDPKPLYKIPASTTYTQGTGCLKLTSKESGKPWKIPYPAQVIIKREAERSFDCGFFLPMNEDEWRTAFCLSKDGDRIPDRLYLQVSPAGALLVRTMNLDFGAWAEGTCAI